jgi:phosphatidylglycerophosphatase A
MKKKIILFLATGFGAGYSPLFPGAVGAGLGFLFSWFLFLLPNYLRVIVSLLFLGVSFIIAQQAKMFFKKADPHEIIIDEVAGVITASLFLPEAGWFWFFGLKFPLFLFLVFLLFGFFDKIKPFPANKIHQAAQKYGIVLDDLVSGIYSGLIVFLLVLLIKSV